MDEAARPGTAVVTGGSRGIGAAIVASFVARGVEVVFTYRDDEEAARTVERRAKQAGGVALPVRLDLRSEADAVALHDVVADRYPSVGSLVLNGGMWAGGRIGSVPETRWIDVVDSNLGGAYRVIRAMLPLVRNDPSPSIVIMSSVMGMSGFPGDTAYGSAKAGLIGLGRSLAKELAPEVRVNIVAPGFIETDMTAAVQEGARRSIHRRVLLERSGEADEIARAVLFLAEDATYCTGSVLVADGGFSC